METGGVGWVKLQAPCQAPWTRTTSIRSWFHSGQPSPQEVSLGPVAGEGHGLPVVGGGLRTIRGIAMRGDLSQPDGKLFGRSHLEPGGRGDQQALHFLRLELGQAAGVGAPVGK